LATGPLLKKKRALGKGREGTAEAVPEEEGGQPLLVASGAVRVKAGNGPKGLVSGLAKQQA